MATTKSKKRPTTKATRRVTLRQTAYHEASHAVIARVLMLACGGATIEPDHESAGHSITMDPWVCLHEWERRGKVRMPDAVFHARIIVYMAGAEGVAVLLGAVPHVGDGDDRYQIAKMAEELDSPAEQWDRIEARLRAVTCMLIRRHQARIERVASALLEKKKLSGTRLDKLVGRSVDDVKVNAPFILAMHQGRGTAIGLTVTAG